MSSWTGKCDLNDSLFIFYDGDFNKIKNNLTLYTYDHQLIKITCPADLIPWYPFVTGISAGQRIDDETYKLTCCLSKESYLDTKIRDFTKYGLDTTYLQQNKQNLIDLYEAEIQKPVELQRIYEFQPKN